MHPASDKSVEVHMRYGYRGAASSMIAACGLSLICVWGCDRLKAASSRVEEVKRGVAAPEAVVHDAILPGPIMIGAMPVPLAPAPPASGGRAGSRESGETVIRLDVVHQVQEVADGTKVMMWTFGGQVPGPTIRVREGDRIRFIMANRSAESAHMTSPMPHSMDFHSAMVNPEDKFRSIAPGQTIEFEYVANYPGLYLYHCATPMIVEHLAHGMYGAMIVEPKNGYPTQVDREYVLIQSEFYPKTKSIDRRGARTGRKQEKAAEVVQMDLDAVYQKHPSIVAFNGKAFRHMKEPLKATAGERIRLFLINAGPGLDATFHVIGTIFDRTWLEGVPANELIGGQSVHLGPSNSAIIELLIPEPGIYELTDHAFANARAGATGLIDASAR